MTSQIRPAPGDFLLASRVLSRRSVLKAGAVTAGVAFASGALAACTSESSPIDGDTPDGKIDTAGSNIFQDLDPHVASAIGTIGITDLVFEALYSMDPVDPARVVPVLAVGEPEVSGNTVTVRLRSGATFHDGSPLRASDVVYSFQRIADAKFASFYARFVAFIGGVTAVDDTTVRFTLKQTSPFLKNRLALVRIVSQKAVKGAKKDQLASKPVGSGPYKAQKIDLTREATLTRFAAYQGPRKPFADTITYAVTADDAARLSALGTGRLDVAYDIPYQDIDRLNAGSTKAEAVPSFAHTDLFFNCKKGAFADPRVRLAILHAIDRDAIRDSVFMGKAENAVSVLPSYHPDFVEPSTKIGHDPDRARTLLAEAGVRNLSFTLFVSNIGFVTPQATLIKSDLEKVGVNARIQPGETESFVPKILDGKYDAWLTIGDATIIGAYDGEFLMRWLYYGFIATGFMYWTAPEQKQVESLLDGAFADSDETSRKAKLAQVQDIVAANAPTFPLHFRQQTAAWSSQLSNLRASPVYGVDLLGG
jgi:peptide/nickel transport system substrate-binding protein